MKVNQIITDKGRFYITKMDSLIYKLLELNNMSYIGMEEVEKICIRYKLSDNNGNTHVKAIYVDTYDEMRKTINNILDYTHLEKIEIEL